MFHRKKSETDIASRRCLVVEVIKAENLIACTKAGDSDPHLTCYLADIGGREIKAESFKIKPQIKTLAPEWNQTFTFGTNYDLDTQGELPSLKLYVYHKAAYSVSDQPMGELTIGLESIDPDGGITELAYPLEISGRMKTVSGNIYLRLHFTRGVTKAVVNTDLETGEEEEDEDAKEQQPNELHVTVVQAVGLIIADKSIFGQGSSDPQVKLKIDGFDSQRTKFIRKNLSPVWNSKHIFPGVENTSLSLVVTVEDHNDIKLTDFLGRTSIPLSDLDNKKPLKKWYTLYNQTMEADGINRGKIELLLHWKFNLKVLEEKRAKEEKFNQSAIGKLVRIGSAVGHAVGAISDSESEPESDHEIDKRAERQRPKTDAEKEEEKKKEEEHKKELNDIEIKSGDYQVQVHIIEARELHAENLDGTSDPIVYVECFGQKQNTIVIKQVTSCVYDELMIFNMKNLDKEAFEEGMLRIACYDSSVMPLVGKTMIGAYAIDASMVYGMNKHHEMYRKWVPLMDDEDPEAQGVQGYLKISIQIIGPGEKIKIHDEDAERAEEIKKEAACGGDIGSLVLSTPTIRKEWKYIVASIYKCEGLPVMDGKVGIGLATVQRAKTDAYCKMSFAGGKNLKLKPVTVHGESRAQINPAFNYEMWYPVSVPTMTQLVRFSVWDKDPTQSELIGNIHEKYSRVAKMPGQATDLQWYNMYGAPEFKNDKLLSNIKKGAAGIAKRANQALGADIDWEEYYNNVPEKATSFKGRALMRFRVESTRPEKYDKNPDIKPFKRKIKALKRAQEPNTIDYILQALIICGTELPSFGTVTSDQLKVKISIGINEISTRAVRLESGQCRWNEFLISETLSFPVDVNQIPDIFIYLVREDMKPVCFTRLKPVVDEKAGTLIGFNNPAKWYLLQEDKSIDALNTDVFPGNVLIKLGFGLASEALRSQLEWKACLTEAKTGVAYQVRVHVYQAKDIPAADGNGLCDPYVKVNFMGQTLRTKTKKETLFPGYYETLVFEDVMIPESKNFEYASQVCFRLYDYDYDGDDYLGTCSYSLQDAVVTQEPNDRIDRLPQWVSFFREVPNDGQGELLVLVQLVPTLGKSITKYAESIFPPTRSAFIELIIIGVRDMAPFNFQSMQSPFLEIELNSFGSSYLSTTNTSKRPEPSNPNFLEKIVMSVTLPENSIFSTPLQIRAKDTRLGGWLKPTVGVCQIDMSTKIPWCEDTYIAPQTDIFFQPETDRGAAAGGGCAGAAPAGIVFGDATDAIGRSLMKLEQERDEEVEQDDFIASAPPITVDEYLKGRVAAEDTGAGVFGALNHIDTTTGKAKKKRTGEDAFTDADWSQDDGDQPPAWSIGRKKLDEELEAEFKTTPFETYNLTRGSTQGMFGSTLKVVGKLKGLVRVILTADEKPLLSEELMSQLLTPQKYMVRLYCLTGKGLAAMDFNMSGGPANSDPYLLVSLGKDVFNDREHYVEDVKDVDLYKLIEFNCELPGTSQLKIALMDADLIGSDDLIGRTTIDLEDRWFDARWQQLGEENVLLPGADSKDPTRVRWQTKPIERRSIYIPAKPMPQGVLEMWLDIMRPEVAGTFPPDDVSLPPTQLFEVRVVIWKCKNVPPMDSLEGMSDLFVKCWPEGCKPAETDTHWRAKKGKASFNWRMLFDVELGHNSRAMKFPYLHLQLWDRDVLKWNDCAGEGAIDIGKYYRKAYKRNVALKLFETKKGAAGKRDEKAKEDKFNRIEVDDTTDDIPSDEEDDDDEVVGNTMFGSSSSNNNNSSAVISPMTGGFGSSTGSNKSNQGAQKAAKYASMSELLPPREEPDSDDDDEDVDDTADTGIGAIPVNKKLNIVPNPADKKRKKKLLKAKQEKKLKKQASAKAAAGGAASSFSWLYFWRKKAPPAASPWVLDEAGNPLLDDNGNPIPAVDSEGSGENEKTEEEKKDDEDSEVTSLINSFKNMTGLWDMDPEDSSWYHLEQKDKTDPSIVIPMGSICYSVQIWPKDKALVMQSGAARSEPNTNPFCPPPVGRLSFSWNPFVMGSALCGPALCAKFFCCLICMAFLVLMIFCQPFLNIIINLVFLVY